MNDLNLMNDVNLNVSRQYQRVASTKPCSSDEGVLVLTPLLIHMTTFI